MTCWLRCVKIDSNNILYICCWPYDLPWVAVQYPYTGGLLLLSDATLYATQEAKRFLTPAAAGAVAMLRGPNYEQQSGGVLGTLQSVKDTYDKDLKEPGFVEPAFLGGNWMGL